MNYQWDYGKALQNLEKHGVDFSDAVFVLEDPLALAMHDPDSQSEERVLALGTDPHGRILVVAYSWRGDAVRVISARKATRREQRRYEEA